MKHYPKLKPALLIFSLLFFYSLNASAQYPGMAAFRAQQTMQLANQQMRMQMQMMNMRGVIGTSQEFDFDVMMLDSTKKQITSAVYTDTITKKHFIVWVDKKYKKSDTNRYKKIFPTQTRSLTCVLIPKSDDGDEPGSYLPGKITDSCWMFKIISGPINAYGYTIQNDTNPLDPSIIVGIQVNNGPILPFNDNNLKTFVAGDPRAVELVANKKYVRAIKRYNSDHQKNE